MLRHKGGKTVRLSYILDVIIGLIGPMSNQRTLDTRRIDYHIQQLNKLFWFQQISKEEKYRKLLMTNYRTRRYLDSPFRVGRLGNSKKAQGRFCKLLNKQLVKGKR